MTVHPIRMPRRPKPPKADGITVTKTDGGIEIRVEPTPAPVVKFPQP